MQGLGARIELPAHLIDNFIKNLDRKEVIQYFLSLGFTSVSLDLEWLISGKLNRYIEIKQLNY